MIIKTRAGNLKQGDLFTASPRKVLAVELHKAHRPWAVTVTLENRSTGRVQREWMPWHRRLVVARQQPVLRLASTCPATDSQETTGGPNEATDSLTGYPTMILEALKDYLKTHPTK